MADVGVRPAGRADADAVTRIQARAWLAGYPDVLPAAVLAQMTAPQALEMWRQRWEQAAIAPPSPHHRLLVAVEAGKVTGFAASAPAADPDHDSATTAELLTLLVDPDHGRAGHGSRLLAATVDLLREDGFRTLVTWVFEAHKVLRTFFGSAGWAPDGARRTFDMDGVLTSMIRLHTDIAPSKPAGAARATG